ncbi:hypothetical protein HELRODRAFT_162573 [Helobdella robusta]|uniref:Uncharacterized protein n=1 Tax=Helobdella robusta TaxID=6412 RepID=T1ESU8_HELRO|nr:hypothetical protein HELRODRAFT_162573 [Helobdella robusta]ESN99086.1 hypothetical protein HELRODRAFT_162573 [Helobdella robusta]
MFMNIFAIQSFTHRKGRRIFEKNAKSRMISRSYDPFYVRLIDHSALERMVECRVSESEIFAESNFFEGPGSGFLSDSYSGKSHKDGVTHKRHNNLTKNDFTFKIWALAVLCENCVKIVKAWQTRSFSFAKHCKKVLCTSISITEAFSAGKFSVWLDRLDNFQIMNRYNYIKLNESCKKLDLNSLKKQAIKNKSKRCRETRKCRTKMYLLEEYGRNKRAPIIPNTDTIPPTICTTAKDFVIKSLASQSN